MRRGAVLLLLGLVSVDLSNLGTVTASRMPDMPEMQATEHDHVTSLEDGRPRKRDSWRTGARANLTTI